ncbi:hypothetical protein Tco_0537713 [Tanacetum coccineum]
MVSFRSQTFVAYYEVTPQSGIPLRCCIFGGVTVDSSSNSRLNTIFRRLSHKLPHELLPFVELYSGDIVSRNVLTLYISSPFVIGLTLWSLLLSPGAVPAGTTLSNRCVRRGQVLRNPFFIIEVDKDAILEFSTIVSSELFDFDVILIFNSFDERHDGFRWLTFLLQEVYPGVP